MKQSHEPTTDPAELAQEQLDQFLYNPALGELASLFGADVLPEVRGERLHALQELAAAHWDFRKGAERQAVDWNDEFIDQEGSEQWNTIFAAADKLGLVESSKPTNKRPNSLAILGGANRSPLDRLRYGLEVVEDFDQVAYLGSSRRLSDAEKEKAADYAPGAETEFDLGCGAFETLLGATMVDETRIDRNGDVWIMRIYEFERSGEVKKGFVLSTPQKIGERRATTYDNYRFFADAVELKDQPEHTVVVATNAFYTLMQGLPAAQELTVPYGTKVEVIGFDAAYGGATRKASQLLQEIKAGIDAAVRLNAALNPQDSVHQPGSF